MDIYLLDNQIPLRSEYEFEDEFHEHPGWNEEMSYTNRSIGVPERIGEHLDFNWWSYNRSWVKKLVPVEEII